MKELAHFKAVGNPVIFIAQAGIHKSEWISSFPGESMKEVFKKMSSNRFSILPILDTDGNCRTFYKTNDWVNFDIDNIVLAQIQPENKLYYLTDIDDAIKRFAETGWNYFFLDNLTDIVGLITISDLNCNQVYLYLYSLTSQFERIIASLIYKNGITDSMIQPILEGRESSENAKKAIENFEKAKLKGFDSNLLEELFLSDLSCVFKKFELDKKCGIERKYWDKTISGLIYKVRNPVAHPCKRLIKNEKSVKDLHQIISSMNVILEKLK